ncbi:MAG: PP2C family protein-serine/threonine phosphatase [Firmicutes bacterium]|nr:PP2C family protein-serine/threonine phosphatase [Bacillota bacterium]
MIKSLRRSVAFNIIGAAVILLVIFGVIVSVMGVTNFSSSFKREYSVTTYHIADTATTLVNGDHLEDYLAGNEMEEYQLTKGYLDEYCKRMNVSLVYVILVDTSDYGRFVSIFNSVNNEVDDSSYTPWELGYQRDTTNNEYRRKYKSIYDQEAAYETVYRLKPGEGYHAHVTTLVPVKGSDGEVKGILCVQRPAREIWDARRPFLVVTSVSVALLSIIASITAAFFIRKKFVIPIQKVTADATRFARENTKGEGLDTVGDFKEFNELAASIDTMETDMVSYIENLTAVTAEKERIGTELSLARRIQESSIPSIFPPFPTRTEFDIYASMDPAREVGGDFYNFFLIDEDHLLLVIGDVSGKGIPASLFMMVTNILLTDRAKMGGTPGEILTYVNTELCEHNTAEMFVTLWLGILEISTGKLTAANAGHEYPVLKRAGGQFELFKDRHGFVCAGMEGIVYKDYEVLLEPGDKVFVYTDGVPEANDADNDLFGMERMIDALNGGSDETPEQVLRNVRTAVDTFVNEAEQFDDLTMLCLEYKGVKQ